MRQLLGLVMRKPEKCVLSITSRCSMRCRMCYNWNLKDEKQIGKERWLSVIDELAMLNPGMLVNIIGGEPLEMPWALDLVYHASSRGLKTSLTTNAEKIDQAMAEKISKSGLTTICISIDSIDPKIHDHYRGKPGILKKAIEAIRLLSKHRNPEIVVQTILMKDNMEGIPRLVEFCSKNKRISGIYFMAAMKPHFSKLLDDWYEHDDLGIWPAKADAERVLDHLISEKKERGHSSKIANNIGQLEAFKRYYGSPKKYVKDKDCDVRDFGLFVNYDGKAQICPEKGVIGDIEKKSIGDIWYSLESISAGNRMKDCRKNCEFLVNCFYSDGKC